MKFKDVVFAITAISTGAACALGVVILTSADTEVDRGRVISVADPVRTTEATTAARTQSSKRETLEAPKSRVPKSPKSPKSRKTAVQSLPKSQMPQPVKPSPSVTKSGKPSPPPKSSRSPSPSASPPEVYYANCDAVREAGAAPIRRGDPGYGRHLDRDGDGVGCED